MLSLNIIIKFRHLILFSFVFEIWYLVIVLLWKPRKIIKSRHFRKKFSKVRRMCARRWRNKEKNGSRKEENVVRCAWARPARAWTPEKRVSMPRAFSHPRLVRSSHTPTSTNRAMWCACASSHYLQSHPAPRWYLPSNLTCPDACLAQKISRFILSFYF